MAKRGKLLNIFGIAFGLAMLVGNTIAVGILRTPGEVAALLPSSALFLGVWLLGGLYALLGAMSLAEPGAMVARSGGASATSKPESVMASGPSSVCSTKSL